MVGQQPVRAVPEVTSEHLFELIMSIDADVLAMADGFEAMTHQVKAMRFEMTGIQNGLEKVQAKISDNDIRLDRIEHRIDCYLRTGGVNHNHAL
ncbi:MAG: hypothetical protein ACRC7G_04905 [Beijerinckiaceae bacterium]